MNCISITGRERLTWVNAEVKRETERVWVSGVSSICKTNVSRCAVATLCFCPVSSQDNKKQSNEQHVNEAATPSSFHQSALTSTRATSPEECTQPASVNKVSYDIIITKWQKANFFSLIRASITKQNFTFHTSWCVALDWRYEYECKSLTSAVTLSTTMANKASGLRPPVKYCR